MPSEFNHMDDFLKNRAFKEWVIRPTPQLEKYWDDFLKSHPEKKEVFSNAREYLLGIKKEVETDFPDEARVGRMYDAITGQIDLADRRLAWKKNIFRWAAAGCMAGLLFWAAWYTGVRQAPAGYEELVRSSGVVMKEHLNNSSGSLLIQLPDCSRIHLDRGSRLSYPADFNGVELREVYLDGSAFFEIETDSLKPFHVYSDELITKVLGTSFRIQSSPEKNEMTVEVLKGKVSVSTREGVQPAGNEELLLTPNQQALFVRKDVSLKKSLVSKPVIIRKPKSKDEFEFDDAPAGDIFRTIEKSYGVEIYFDESKLGHCLLTASLSDETLFEMLDLLCSALDARYFVEGTEIVITGSGCSTSK